VRRQGDDQARIDSTAQVRDNRHVGLEAPPYRLQHQRFELVDERRQITSEVFLAAGRKIDLPINVLGDASRL
jgi:hypothetical protein